MGTGFSQNTSPCALRVTYSVKSSNNIMVNATKSLIMIVLLLYIAGIMVLSLCQCYDVHGLTLKTNLVYQEESLSF